MESFTKSYVGINATGALPVVALPAPMRSSGMQVSIPSGAITSWTVALEGSLDGVNWTALVTHNATIGSTQWAIDKPVSFIRVNPSALALNTAPSISVLVVAVP